MKNWQLIQALNSFPRGVDVAIVPLDGADEWTPLKVELAIPDDQGVPDRVEIFAKKPGS